MGAPKGNFGMQQPCARSHSHANPTGTPTLNTIQPNPSKSAKQSERRRTNVVFCFSTSPPVDLPPPSCPRYAVIFVSSYNSDKKEQSLIDQAGERDTLVKQEASQQASTLGTKIGAQRQQQQHVCMYVVDKVQYNNGDEKSIPHNNKQKKKSHCSGMTTRQTRHNSRNPGNRTPLFSFLTQIRQRFCASQPPPSFHCYV